MPETEAGSERHRFCPSCGAKAVTGASFCGECGSSISNEPQPPANSPVGLIHQQDSPQAIHAAESSSGGSPAKRSRSKGILLIAVLVIVVGGVASALVLTNNRTTDNRATATSTTKALSASSGASTTAPSALTTTTTTTSTNQAPTASLIATLQAFFANGCNGGCASTSEPASAFNVTFDPNNPDWAKWTVNDPNIGAAAGFYESVNGVWQVVAGPGSQYVGCPPGPGVVPSQILSDFGGSCPPS